MGTLVRLEPKRVVYAHSYWVSHPTCADLDGEAVELLFTKGGGYDLFVVFFFFNS